MIKITLKDVTGSEFTIERDNHKLEKHLLDPTNHVCDILKQLNKGIYTDFIDTSNKEQVMLDLGANVGFFSLHVQSVCKQMICVEPAPMHFELLNFLMQDYQHVTPVEAAINKANETVDFFLAPKNQTMCSLLDYEEARMKISVPGRTIRSIIDEFNLDKVDFCKIDIEGGEAIALHHEQISSVKDVVDCFFVECHASVDAAGDPKQCWWVKHDIMKIFSANGYFAETGAYHHHRENPAPTWTEEIIENLENTSITDRVAHDTVVAKRIK